MSAAGGAGATALTVDAAVLSVFWELASVQAAKREARSCASAGCCPQSLTSVAQAAAKQLVAELSRAQSEFDASKCALPRAVACRVVRRRIVGWRLTRSVAAAAGPALPRTLSPRLSVTRCAALRAAWVPAERCVACAVARRPVAAAARVAGLRETHGTDWRLFTCQGARQGFALAFTGAVAALPCLSAKAALDTLHTHSEPITGSAKVRPAVHTLRAFCS